VDQKPIRFDSEWHGENCPILTPGHVAYVGIVWIFDFGFGIGMDWTIDCVIARITCWYWAVDDCESGQEKGTPIQIWNRYIGYRHRRLRSTKPGLLGHPVFAKTRIWKFSPPRYFPKNEFLGIILKMVGGEYHNNSTLASPFLKVPQIPQGVLGARRKVAKMWLWMKFSGSEAHGLRPPKFHPISMHSIPIFRFYTPK
jgi:hypothetical protein